MEIFCLSGILKIEKYSTGCLIKDICEFVFYKKEGFINPKDNWFFSRNEFPANETIYKKACFFTSQESQDEKQLPPEVKKHKVGGIHLVKKFEPDLYQDMTKFYSPLITSYEFTYIAIMQCKENQGTQKIYLVHHNNISSIIYIKS